MTVAFEYVHSSMTWILLNHYGTMLCEWWNFLCLQVRNEIRSKKGICSGNSVFLPAYFRLNNTEHNRRWCFYLNPYKIDLRVVITIFKAIFCWTLQTLLFIIASLHNERARFIIFNNTVLTNWGVTRGRSFVTLFTSHRGIMAIKMQVLKGLSILINTSAYLNDWSLQMKRLGNLLGYRNP